LQKSVRRIFRAYTAVRRMRAIARGDLIAIDEAARLAASDRVRGDAVRANNGRG